MRYCTFDRNQVRIYVRIKVREEIKKLVYCRVVLGTNGLI